MLILIYEPDLVFLLSGGSKFDEHLLCVECVHGSPYVIRGDGQVAGIAPVNKNDQFYPGGPPEGDHGIQCGPYRAAGVQHVVNEHDFFLLEAEGNSCFAGACRFLPPAKVVAVESGIQKTEGYGFSGQRFKLFVEKAGQMNAAGLKAQDYGVFEITVVFQNLVAKAVEGEIEKIRI
jgi:hypothetical protein